MMPFAHHVTVVTRIGLNCRQYLPDSTFPKAPANLSTAEPPRQYCLLASSYAIPQFLSVVISLPHVPRELYYVPHPDPCSYRTVPLEPILLCSALSTFCSQLRSSQATDLPTLDSTLAIPSCTSTYTHVVASKSL